MYFTSGPLRTMERAMRQVPRMETGFPDTCEELLGHLLLKTEKPSLARKAWGAYNSERAPVRIFTDSCYKGRFMRQISPCGFHAPRALAALFLLTSDTALWNGIQQDVAEESIRFRTSLPRHPANNLLYRFAEELYFGKTFSQLTAYLTETKSGRDLLLLLNALLFLDQGFELIQYCRKRLSGTV